MKKMVIKLGKYIPVLIFVLGSSLHDMWATNPTFEIIESTKGDVNWIVFYYTFIYVSWLIHCIIMITKYNYIYFGALSISLFVRVLMELKCLGMTYEQYCYNVTNFKSVFVPLSWFIIGLLMIIIHYAIFNRDN